MSMTSIAETLDRMAGDRFQQLTDDDRMAVDAVLNAADEFCNKRLMVHEFAKLGGVRSVYSNRISPEYSRFVALISTPNDDPRRKSLRRAINAVLTFQGLIVTTAGVWSPEDLGIPSSMGQMRVHPAPVRDPWQEAA